MTDTFGMNIAQRILHVGGRNNAAGYVEFGSIQAVEALVRQVLRDLPPAEPAPTMEPLGTEFAAVLHKNLWELYETEPAPEPVQRHVASVFARAVEQGVCQKVGL